MPESSTAATEIRRALGRRVRAPPPRGRRRQPAPTPGAAVQRPATSSARWIGAVPGERWPTGACGSGSCGRPADSGACAAPTGLIKVCPSPIACSLLSILTLSVSPLSLSRCRQGAAASVGAAGASWRGGGAPPPPPPPLPLTPSLARWRRRLRMARWRGWVPVTSCLSSILCASSSRMGPRAVDAGDELGASVGGAVLHAIRHQSVPFRKGQIRRRKQQQPSRQAPLHPAAFVGEAAAGPAERSRSGARARACGGRAPRTAVGARRARARQRAAGLAGAERKPWRGAEAMAHGYQRRRQRRCHCAENR
ncbi:uncharacterized protein LOC120678841 [Panicum virgatum]|uniref:uncharacterized protein LOC120678841 n=1 Tax=Panicum virgatum TaxID=38727 RepID=UPI0019D55C6F|nr:uncharacterized protein LOC120678841 [Panicum virgatum]XP_039816174.1 uncharacterized protein LOC120678841 [Panicum virgatum]XP_039816175.1 uncharacterized protein LOC120678841 [Panicum virgatum]XP_039816176.1 uncharacterized protein LOC120678841 [Panicum virgatum]XP_039816177.1 uncharacterized protein LOC120678841 [Panicum virgatum]XP_039816179.1 uncharacterized protein LOC120678841 [Panicum virgatum]XP_039816180.1 uncharacterized protein LOC120678841 [Panicum virgatum]XP_039816181.1 unc